MMNQIAADPLMIHTKRDSYIVPSRIHESIRKIYAQNELYIHHLLATASPCYPLMAEETTTHIILQKIPMEQI